MTLDNNTQAYFELVRVGLWADMDANLDLLCKQSDQGRTNDKVDWEKVYQLAVEQSVIGLVLAGIEHSNVKPPQELLLQWIGEVQMLEHQNKAMNVFIALFIYDCYECLHVLFVLFFRCSIGRHTSPSKLRRLVDGLHRPD